MWDLKDLYNSTNDKKINQDKIKLEKLVLQFNKNYKNQVKLGNKNLLLSAIEDFENIISISKKLSGYAYLIHSVDTIDAKISSFYQKIHEFEVDINNKLIWFTLEIQNINENKLNGIIKDTKFSKYNYYLKEILKMKPFVLDEEKEILISKKNQTGNEAFVKLYDKFSSNQLYDGLTYSEVSSIFVNNSDRYKRKKAGETITNNFKQNIETYSFILNTLLLDKKVSDEIRKFKFAEQETLLNYDVNKDIIALMSKVITENYSISEKYYLAKSKLLKTDLYEWDRYNDIYPLSKNKIIWEEAKNITLEAFKNFSPLFYDIANDFFIKNRIDYEIKKGKRGGAYCYYATNKIQPYVFMNFTGENNDVKTLAHELGHAIHGVLSNSQSELEHRPSTATAEIASVFAESLIFDDLYKKASSKKDKINLLASKLQNTFATVFRQNAFYLFEKEIHQKRRVEGELSSTEICNLYQKTLSPMFGKGLTLTDNHKYMWANISHFYHYNFYVFTYAFGELLATSLYAKYKKEGSKFARKYIAALKLGGSKSPLEITKTMGVNIYSESFWQDGLNLIKEDVEEFEKIVNS